VLNKDKIKRFTAENALLEQFMFHFYRLRNAKAFQQEVDLRRDLSIFDYQRLSEDLPYAPSERVIDNNLYGYARYLKEFAGITQDLKAYMEHGLFLGRIVHQDQYHWHFPRIITMSEGRRAILKDKIPQKESIAIGPYIHYAPSLYRDAQMKSLKEKLGKVLLVYPFHSMKNVKSSFNDYDLIEEIKRVGKNYDSVLISLYYLDALDKDKQEAYASEGFHLISAGHKFDPNFVARQRAHIELADLTMSNGMGTQTGFCIYLNKPHYIFQQDINQKAISKQENQRFNANSAGSDKELVAYQRSYFSQLFSELRSDISEHQRAETAKFWGFESIKTKEELRAIWPE
jgi:hypothetical protein